MKNLIILLTIGLVFSCQPEERDIRVNYEENLTASSPLISLISRVCQNETACDNILDNSSCFSVNLPVTIVLNGQEIVVASYSDFDTVSAIIDESQIDDDIIHFNFPITIRYANSQEVVIDNELQLSNVSEACPNSGFNEIVCISFNFPMVINTYDSNAQFANSFTISSDPQLYDFITGLSESDLISIIYPISVTDIDGHTILINNNTQLEDVIETAIQRCQNFGPSPNSILDILTTGSWYVSYYFDYWDETANYAGYNFTFLPNGTLTAVKSNTIVNGDWNLNMDGGNKRLEFYFDGPAFQELECNWKVVEFNDTNLHLSNQNGGGSGGPGDRDGNSNYYLYLTKN